MGYLEKQREQWPRFYFIGNEDLLEIIGNSRNVTVISKHMKKMFTGISELVYDSHLNLIKGIVSSENETVTLKNPVSLIAHHSLNEWLTQLEVEIKNTLSALLNESLEEFEGAWSSNSLKDKLTDWIKLFPNQVLILTMQVHWTKVVEDSAGKRDELDSLREFYQSLLGLLSGLVLNDLQHLDRLKIENVVIETLHQKNVIEDLLKQKNPSLKSFDWRSQQRYYIQTSLKSSFESLIVKQGNASFVYGYEYLGVPNRLVYTPLVNTCFASLTETLNQRLGGSLVGPAGTGKTESVKALGQNLGRMVLVFCCDETFDYQAVTRILIGICRTGTWGCFDEFNRLDEKMLSAIATEIEKIETALSVDGNSDAVILGKHVQVHKDSGIFITSNPGYAGRTVLPDNLKNNCSIV
ncbi:unnamed protein product [Ambrosiozyma monospora]|uniref:Dynein heavy chain, cytoplasmic n=1 Tax=Ambrosiozyma monospora TaxID=43982 RepID=A0A9W7DPL2_AMBMO|nr:unnamed protein product [Ambrosiozyma monospora]